MRYNFLFIIGITTIAFAACQKQREDSTHDHATAKTEAPADTVKKSIPKAEHAQVGGTHFTITYHAPAVRGRTIWGGLVPFGEVWVTGAHSATSIEFDKAVTINNTKIPAGKYAFFTIPDREKWTIILNKNWEQHLTDEYDAKEDVLRMEVTPETTANVQERLRYSVVDKGNSEVSVDVRWEKIRISVPVQL